MKIPESPMSYTKHAPGQAEQLQGQLYAFVMEISHARIATMKAGLEVFMSALIISHCLEIMAIEDIRLFSNLMILELYNSSIFGWPASAWDAPLFVTRYMITSRLTGGLSGRQLPRYTFEHSKLQKLSHVLANMELMDLSFELLTPPHTHTHT